MILNPARKKISKNYFQSKDVLKLAQNILGMAICTNFNRKFTSGIIVETEAYKGINDKASHAYGKKKTTKNNSMYLNGGTVYIYKCYGIHNLFNIRSLSLYYKSLQLHFQMRHWSIQLRNCQ